MLYKRVGPACQPRLTHLSNVGSGRPTGDQKLSGQPISQLVILFHCILYVFHHPRRKNEHGSTFANLATRSTQPPRTLNAPEGVKTTGRVPPARISRAITHQSPRTPGHANPAVDHRKDGYAYRPRTQAIPSCQRPPRNAERS